MNGISNLLGNRGKMLHQVLMLDELAVKKRVQYHDKSNRFVGTCREHSGHISLEFNSVNDMVGLFREIDDGHMHYVTEVCFSRCHKVCLLKLNVGHCRCTRTSL